MPTINPEGHEPPSWSTQKHMDHEARLASIEAQLPHLATRDFVREQINSLLWKLVGVVASLVLAVFFIAKHVN